MWQSKDGSEMARYRRGEGDNRSGADQATEQTGRDSRAVLISGQITGDRPDHPRASRDFNAAAAVDSRTMGALDPQ